MSLIEAEPFSDVRRVAHRQLSRPVLGFLRAHRVRIGGFILLCTVSTAFGLVQPFFFREIIDAALGQRAARVGLTPAADASLGVLALLLLLVGVLNVATSLWVARFQ